MDVSRMSAEEAQKFMQAALDLAKKAERKGDVPIGAVVVDLNTKEIIGKGYNRRERRKQAIWHAEIEAIRRANAERKNWRLNNCALFVTVEPCVMCAGAISLARISEVYYGAKNPKFGAVSSLYRLLEDERLNHQAEIFPGLLEEQASALMKDFFKAHRKV